MKIENDIKKIQLRAGELPLEIESVNFSDRDVIHIYLHPSCLLYVDGEATEKNEREHGCHLVIVLGKVQK